MQEFALWIGHPAANCPNDSAPLVAGSKINAANSGCSDKCAVNREREDDVK
jgi:hypothetical protein